MEFERYKWSEQDQSFVLYQAMVKLCKSSFVEDDGNFFINGLIYLNGLFRILNDHYHERIQHENILMWDVMYQFCIFLREKWEKGESTRVIYLYEEFSSKNNISKGQFEQVVDLLEELQFLEILNVEKKMVRFIRPIL
ncbi:MAG: hypothetical protein ACFFDF_03985 [Candidatus Odinarchaeota archaeon]